jgi:IS5 family transposase
MLILGYCYGIRSERRLCEEVHLNLGYRWFCRLGLAGEVPDHSTFSKNRHGRFRESDLLRQVFETVLRCCLEEGLVGGDGFAVDASLIKADASRQKGAEGAKGLAPEVSSRAVEEYLAVLDAQRLALRPRSRRSSSRPPIRPRAGRALTEGRRCALASVPLVFGPNPSLPSSIEPPLASFVGGLIL